MKMSTGQVVDGKIVVEGVELVEGSTVIVLEEDDDEVIAITAEQEAELDAASAEIKRDNFRTPAELFALLKRDRDGTPSPL